MWEDSSTRLHSQPKAFEVSWLKRHPVVTNLILAFGIALSAGLWANFFTTASETEPMSDRKHLLLILAVALLGLQCWYNQTTSRAERRSVSGLLDLGIRFFMAHAKKNVPFDELRVIVHLCEKARPGADEPRQRCLVPRYWRANVAPDDRGVIPLDDKYLWYANVRAFHRQQVVCDEPIQATRPSVKGHAVNNPELFRAKSVISAPIWSRIGPPSIIGTLTFDCKYHSLEQLDWSKNGVANEAVKDMLKSMSDLIGKIISGDESTP